MAVPSLRSGREGRFIHSLRSRVAQLAQELARPLEIMYNSLVENGDECPGELGSAETLEVSDSAPWSCLLNPEAKRTSVTFGEVSMGQSSEITQKTGQEHVLKKKSTAQHPHCQDTICPACTHGPRGCWSPRVAEEQRGALVTSRDFRVVRIMANGRLLDLIRRVRRPDVPDRLGCIVMTI